jgi:hypothetical protein
MLSLLEPSPASVFLYAKKGQGRRLLFGWRRPSFYRNRQGRGGRRGTGRWCIGENHREQDYSQLFLFPPFRTLAAELAYDFTPFFQKGDGSSGITVGQPIALLAEEGDDISNLEVPAETSQEKPSPSEEPKKASQPEQPSPAPESQQAPKEHVTPHHSKPLFPSVLLLLEKAGISDASSIKGAFLLVPFPISR